MHSAAHWIPSARLTSGYRWPRSTRQTLCGPPRRRQTRIMQASRSAAPTSVELDGEVRYGAAAAVPSLLDAPATTAWTVVVLASEAPARVSRLLDALRAHAPAGTQVVVVANDPSEAQAATLLPEAADLAPIGGTVPEVLRTSARLGYAAAVN